MLKRRLQRLSESIHVKTPHCWKSHALAQLTLFLKMNNEHNWSVQRIGFMGVKSLLKHSCIAIKWIKNIGIDRQMF